MSQVITKQKTSLASKVAYSVVAGAAIGFFAGLGGYLSRQVLYNQGKINCAPLTEAACLDTIQCQPVFGNGSEFVSCKTLLQEQVAQRNLEATLCSKTKGQYVRSRFGPYCDCSVSFKRYVPQVGCQ